ncbi:N-acetylmuramoyl-L-alanine amidase family protein [Tunturiibacter lichenicola]|uniref:N-acetylmuramoyl-L-alanine amidase family protein n=1 Tax=Tunturiibacter lichenicola TaxID=2051959 RepID=UPI0021B21865|nr:N-acetylmuramoyl-L-alanine amidase [Edaphobacter lichenicola]
MTSPHRQIATLFLALMAATAIAQQTPTPRTLILIDPAHGGPDPGAKLADNVTEKSLTMAFGARLRALLTTNGFSVMSTHEADPTVTFTTDQRAEIANHAHPTACLILHATNSGNGIHLITSELPLPDDTYDPDAHHPIPWNTAQAASIPQSRALANQIGLALIHTKLPVLVTRASIRPLDNLTCPALAVEIAPLTRDDDTTPVTDTNYQQQVAQAIAAGLSSWRSRQLADTGAGATTGASR